MYLYTIFCLSRVSEATKMMNIFIFARLQLNEFTRKEALKQYLIFTIVDFTFYDRGAGSACCWLPSTIIIGFGRIFLNAHEYS